jgi:hypothetical protein
LTDDSPRTWKPRLNLVVGLAIVIVIIGVAVGLPIIPVTTYSEYQVTVLKPGSPVSTRIYNETYSLSEVTFQMHQLEIAFDQMVNVTWVSSDKTDLVAILSNTTTDTFVQTVMLDVGVPIGPSLFTNRNVTPLVIEVLKEKLPEIMAKAGGGGYYKIDESGDTTRLQLKAGTYDFVLLAIGKSGQLQLQASYKSSETMVETRTRVETTSLTVLGYLLR